MIFNIVGGGSGGRYSLLTVTTDEASLVGETVTVTATGEGAETETYNKTLTSSLSIEFKLKQLTTYTISCGDALPQTLTIVYFGDYTAELLRELVLYDNGEEVTAITGGWQNNNGRNFQNSDGRLRIQSGTSGSLRTCRTVEPIDLTHWNYLYVDGIYTNSSAEATTDYAQIGYGTATGVTATANMSPTRGNFYLDISEVEGEHYIHLGCKATTYYTYAYKIWLAMELEEDEVN